MIKRVIMACVLLALPVIATAAEKITVVKIIAPARSDGGKLAFTGTPAIVDEQGWLRAELAKKGLTLEFVPAALNAVAAQVNEAFAKKSVQFAAYGDLPALIANSNGINVKLLVPGGGQNNTYLVVPWDSKAKSIKDLQGKKIALHRGRPWEFPFSKLIAANGLDFKDFQLLNLNPQAGAAAVSTGSADAFFTLSDAFLLEDKKVGRIIWASKTAPQDWKMRAELWGEGDFIAQHPDITQLVATAFVKANYWGAQPENKEKYIQISIRGNQPRSVIERELANDQLNWQQRWSPLFDAGVQAHYREVNQYALSIKLTRKSVAVNQLFAPQFVTEALKSLQLPNYWSAAKGQ